MKTGLTTREDAALDGVAGEGAHATSSWRPNSLR